MMYFAVKVTSGQERIAANMLQNKLSKGEGSNIYAILVIGGMRGYIILEAEDEMAVKSFITKEHNIHGVLPRPLSKDDIDKLLANKTQEQEAAKGDIVEFSTGPFKGYKARVLKVDPIKAEMTVELMDVVVPIPITTKLNTAKVIQRAKNESNA